LVLFGKEKQRGNKFGHDRDWWADLIWIREGMREGTFLVNERKHTHGLVLFGKEKQWEINLGVMIRGWDLI
jgi:hypothetical protein